MAKPKKIQTKKIKIISKKKLDLILDEKFKIKKTNVDFDNHEIRKDWNEFRDLVDLMQQDVDKFLQGPVQVAARRIRVNLMKLRHIGTQIRKSIYFQRQDNSNKRDI